jgi:hypothetical protein
MPTTIRILVDGLVVEGELLDTACATEIVRSLPFDVTPGVWGDEFYFEIPVTWALDETATTTVDVGDIGYWPPGRALAIFFGPTPMSTDDRPVPASEVNLVGRISGDAGVLRRARGAHRIRVTAA